MARIWSPPQVIIGGAGAAVPNAPVYLGGASGTYISAPFNVAGAIAVVLHLTGNSAITILTTNLQFSNSDDTGALENSASTFFGIANATASQAAQLGGVTNSAKVLNLSGLVAYFALGTDAPATVLRQPPIGCMYRFARIICTGNPGASPANDNVGVVGTVYVLRDTDSGQLQPLTRSAVVTADVRIRNEAHSALSNALTASTTINADVAGAFNASGLLPGVMVGSIITGSANIPAGTAVISKAVGGSSLIISAATTGAITAGTNLTFTPGPFSAVSSAGSGVTLLTADTAGNFLAVALGSVITGSANIPAGTVVAAKALSGNSLTLSAATTGVVTSANLTFTPSVKNGSSIITLTIGDLRDVPVGAVVTGSANLPDGQFSFSTRLLTKVAPSDPRSAQVTGAIGPGYVSAQSGESLTFVW